MIFPLGWSLQYSGAPLVPLLKVEPGLKWWQLSATGKTRLFVRGSPA
jgi:hypothetical protein